MENIKKKEEMPIGHKGEILHTLCPMYWNIEPFKD
jgi:hypothetical protein